MKRGKALGNPKCSLEVLTETGSTGAQFGHRLWQSVRLGEPGICMEHGDTGLMASHGSTKCCQVSSRAGQALECEVEREGSSVGDP